MRALLLALLLTACGGNVLTDAGDVDDAGASAGAGASRPPGDARNEKQKEQTKNGK